LYKIIFNVLGGAACHRQFHVYLGRSCLHWAHELLLLISSLETTMTELGGSVDELELDLLLSTAAGLVHKGLTEGDQTTLDTRDSTLEHDVVLVHLTIVGEATERGDTLDSQIELGGGIVGDDLAVSSTDTRSDPVHLLVHLGTVMVTVLTSASDSELDTRWMPRTDTGDLAQTLVGLARELGDTPTGNDTLVTLTLGDSDGVDHLVLLEDRADGNRLLEQALSEGDLVGHGATIHLDLANVCLLLTEVQLADLGVAEHTENRAVLLDLLLLGSDAVTLGVLLRIAGEGLLVLGGAPVLVEATLALLGQVLCPGSGHGLEATRGLVVADHTAHNHWGALEDGDGLDDLLLVSLGASLVHITENVGGAGLVAHEGCEVRSLGGVIHRKRFDLALGFGATLPGEESQGAMTRPFELAVRLGSTLSKPCFCSGRP